MPFDQAGMDALLADSLEDRRLSREERRDLKATILTGGLNADDRRFVRNSAFALAEAAMADADARAVAAWLHDVTKAIDAVAAGPERVDRVYFSPGEECLNAILRFIGEARVRLDVCVFTITDDRIAAALEDSLRRNLRVRIIADDDKTVDRGSDVDRLARAGIETRMDDSPAHMHHKFAIADGAMVLTGSYNWTRGAARENQENLLITNTPDLVQRYAQEFDRLWAQLGSGPLR